MSIKQPQPAAIPRILAGLEQEAINGVQGLKEVTSGKAGPRLYLGMGTHGDEQMGLALAAPLLFGEVELLQGSVLLALHNIRGLHDNKRRIPGDRNFNRLPADILERRDGLYSTERIQALSRAGAFDVTHGFDAHTFKVPGDPIKLHIKGDTALADKIGITDYVTHIVDHQKESDTQEPTLAFGNLLGGIENNSVPVVEVEGGGPHTNPRVIRGLLSGFLATLVKLEMVAPDQVGLIEKVIEQKTYKVCSWQRATEGYEVTKQFGQFEAVETGTVIATKPNASPILCPENAHIVMPPDKGIVKKASSWFWAEAPKKSLITAWVLR